MCINLYCALVYFPINTASQSLLRFYLFCTLLSMSTCHSVLWSLEDKQEWVLSFRQELNSVLWAWQQISYLLSQLAGHRSYLCSPSHLYGTSKHSWLVHFSPFGWGEVIFTHFRIICISSSRIYLFIKCVWFKLYVYICHLFKHLCTCVCNCVDTHVPAGAHGCVREVDFGCFLPCLSTFCIEAESLVEPRPSLID